MKKTVLIAIAMTLLSSAAYAKSCYTVTTATCKHVNWESEARYASFFLLGHYREKYSCNDRYHIGIENAANAFLKSEYARDIEKYCKSYTLGVDIVFQYSKKSKANKRLSEYLDDCMNSDTYAKCVKIKGWNVDDWDD